MQSRVTAHRHVVLRLPSGLHKVIEVMPNTIISIGKFGSFPSNLIIGRPYYFTYETLEDGEDRVRLRVVPPSELNAEALSSDITPSESRGDAEVSLETASDAGEDGVWNKNNQLTVDDTSRQTLSMEEIEELKKAGSGREVIAKIKQAHANLDEKTVFSLAKYHLRKVRKYMKRFTVLPLDIGTLTYWLSNEKDAQRIFDLRDESLGLILSWANIHHAGWIEDAPRHEDGSKIGGSRWLVVDETGGLLVAAIAEKMGILYPTEKPVNTVQRQESPDEEDVEMDEADANEEQPPPSQEQSNPRPHRRQSIPETNTIHLLHANAQPNLSLLKYFGYDTNNPSATHPLHSHLKPLSWLQLLDPASDYAYTEPPTLSDAELRALKAGKRGAYHRKRRRWERIRSSVDEARAGGFDGLIVSSVMDPATILAHTVPLIRGGGNLVVYSPTIEPLTRLIDLYSRERRAAYLSFIDRHPGETPPRDDFPVDPRLLLGPSVQTSRARQWQVLPGRTHPVMTMRGGSEGYIFTARRVLPVEGQVQARGNFAKKRKTG